MPPPEELFAAARAAGASPEEATTLVAVAMAESGGQYKVNDSIGETPTSRRGVERCRSVGPWQINYCPKRDGDTIRARVAAAPNGPLSLHAQAAVTIMRQQGFGAWTMYSNGGYRRFLTVAQQAASSSAGGGGEATPVGFPNPLDLLPDAPSLNLGPLRGGEARDPAPFDLLPSLPFVGDLDRTLWQFMQIGAGAAALVMGLIVLGKDVFGAAGNVAQLIPHPAAQAAGAAAEVADAAT